MLIYVFSKLRDQNHIFGEIEGLGRLYVILDTVTESF